MIAVISKEYDYLEGATVIVSTSEVTCSIIEGNEAPEGWRRVSLSIARDLCFKSSATWVTPDNSTDGRKIFNDLIESWVNYIATSSSNPEDSSRGSQPILLAGSVKKKTLMDVYNDRKRRAKWQ